MDSVNDSLNRGVEIKILADIHGKTIRFFDQLDKRIEVRHQENMSQFEKSFLTLRKFFSYREKRILIR